MNIWDQVKEMPLADYYDIHSGYIYHIAEYTNAKKFGLPSPCKLRFGYDGIIVSENGHIIGCVREDS